MRGAKIHGLAELNRKLKALAPAATKAANAALHQGADEVVAMQKSLAPFEDGALQGSIQKEEIGETKLIVKAGGQETTRPVRVGQKATYDYALGHEFGTAKMKPTPFFYPAWRALKKRVRGRVSRSVNKAIKQAAQR